MPAILLTGKEPAERILKDIEPRARKLSPKLAIVQVGTNAESDTYIRAKLKACENIGIRTEHRKLPHGATFHDLIACIDTLNADANCTGTLIQLPLPDALWKDFPLITRAMSPAKDVDGFTARNLGKLFIAKDFEHLPPATPAGIIELLTSYDIPIAGKHAVIVGRSNLVGKPLSIMLLNRDATVTICHSQTPDLASYTSRADILVSAVGKPGLITSSMVKKGAVVIDVGMRRESGKLTGDVAFDSVKDIACAITPVPGGIGPLTVACLLRNVVRAAENTIPNFPLPKGEGQG